MQIKEKFYTFAKFLACPYVLNLDAVKPFTSRISIIMVGAATTDICSATSTVDLCILATRETCGKIKPEIEWNSGKYFEMTISGVKTRYYLEAIEDVVAGLTKLDDTVFYLYANAVPLDDVSGAYKNIRNIIAEQQLIEKRKSHVFRSLVRRRRAVASFFDESRDPMGRMGVAQDAIKGILRAVAVYDGIPYDPKNMPYFSATAGETGKLLQPCIDELIVCMGRLVRPEDASAQKQFITLIDNCISAIS